MGTGQHVANNSLLINISRLLWAYNIKHAYTELPDGQKIKQEVDSLAFTNSFNSNPLPFEARFEVRSKTAEEVVRREWEGVEKHVDVLLGRIKSALGTGR